MGYVYVAKCCSCNHEFSADEGDGFFFHLLHCETCGQSKTLEFDEIGKIHYDYMRGLLGHAIQPPSSMRGSADADPAEGNGRGMRGVN